jgi:hypothetical protein
MLSHSGCPLFSFVSISKTETGREPKSSKVNAGRATKMIRNQWMQVKVGHGLVTKREKNRGWVAVDGQQSHRRSPFLFLWRPCLPRGSCLWPLGSGWGLFLWSCLLGWGAGMPLGLVKSQMRRCWWRRDISGAEQHKDQKEAGIKTGQSQCWANNRMVTKQNRRQGRAAVNAKQKSKLR